MLDFLPCLRSKAPFGSVCVLKNTVMWVMCSVSDGKGLKGATKVHQDVWEVTF